MIWDDFYDRVFDWRDSAAKKKIPSLEDVGPGEEIVDVLLNLSDPNVRALLVSRAMELHAVFSPEDLANLDGELPEKLYTELVSYAGFDPADPWFGEDSMTWDDFYDAYSDWSDEVTARRVQKLRHFGPSDEVCDAIDGMPSFDLSDALFRKALAHGVHFSGAQLSELGYTDLLSPPDQEKAPLGERKPVGRKPKKPGLWAWLIAIAAAFSGKKDSGRCDGDCAGCPAHYGYRYGRWYYGHGHQHRCQRGGNGGASGRCSRD